MAAAPIRPVTWVRDPACSATGVRVALPLAAKPPTSAEDSCVIPSAASSWSGSTRSCRARGERMRDHRRVRERDQRDRGRRREQGHEVRPGDGRQADGREAARHLADDAHAGREPEQRHDRPGQDDCDQRARYALGEAPQHQDDREAGQPQGGRGRHDPAVDDPPDEPLDRADHVVRRDGEPEELRQLAGQDHEGDPVHVADPDRPREQVGEEAEARRRREEAEGAGHHRDRRGELDRPARVPGGERDDHRREERQQRRVRSEHEDPRGSKQEVPDQRADRRVQAGDRGQAGRAARSPSRPGTRTAVSARPATASWRRSPRE